MVPSCGKKTDSIFLVVCKLFPFFRGSFQGCLLEAFGLFWEQLSVYFLDGLSVNNHDVSLYNPFTGEFNKQGGMPVFSGPCY